MKSKASILIIISVLAFLRLYYSDINHKPINVLTYDAFGYYMYLPSFFIYDNPLKLAWISEIDEKYEVTGGNLYQANILDNENYIFKYYGGTAIMQSPFFAAAHLYAQIFGYEKDGFSKPYQIAIVVAAFFYAIIGLCMIRKSLLHYFSDSVAAISIILVVLASNIPQYISIDCGQTHCYLFFLYACLVYFSKKWHDSPKLIYAILIGMISGLAIAIRPTEGIIILIPLLWSTHNKVSSKAKWLKVRNNLNHVLFALLFGFLMLCPQFIYWKYSSGSFIYDVGSKWSFLNPFFRVLFGWEKGWFIYTPVTIIFILSLIFIKNFEFKKSIWLFTFFNIWIVISWFDWRYGGSYSTRALSQSYPLFILSMAPLIDKIILSKWRLPFYFIGVYLIFVNLFQLYQYNENILHFDDMNKKYYAQIYLNPTPGSLDYSLLDTKDWCDVDNNLNSELLINFNDTIIHINSLEERVLVSTELEDEISFIRTFLKMQVWEGFWHSEIEMTISSTGDTIKKQNFRLNIPYASPDGENVYEFYTKVPESCRKCTLTLSLIGDHATNARITTMRISEIQLQ